MNIDIESSIILDLVSRYQTINSDVANMASGCSKPNIPSFLDVGENINSLMETVQKSENQLIDHLNSVSNIIFDAINTLRENDEVNLMDFIDIVENPDFIANNNANDKELSDEEKRQMLFELCLANIEASDFANMINSNINLSDEDKEYINSQLDKGNIRSALCRLLIIEGKQDLDELLDLQGEVNKKRTKVEEWINFANVWGNIVIDGKVYYLDDLLKIKDNLDADIKEIKDAITSNRLMNLQYQNSEKEWEYDCYLNLIGTEEFENSLSLTDDFYRAALINYYNQEGASEDFDYIAFYYATENWLNSGELSEEEKAKYLQIFSNISPEGRANLGHYQVILAANALAQEGYDNLNFKGAYDNHSFCFGNELVEAASSYFDDDHLKLLNYICNQEGANAAEEYLNVFSDYFNRCYGFEHANNIVNNILNGENISNIMGDLSSLGNGVLLGIDNWFQQVGNILSTNGQMTESEYTMMYVNNLLGSLGYLKWSTSEDFTNLGFTEEQYNELMNNYGDVLTDLSKNLNKIGSFGKRRSEWLQTFFGAGVSAGNMVPSVAASLLTSGVLSGLGVAGNTVNVLGKAKTVGEVASRTAGLSMMFLGCVSSSKNEALRNGRSIVEAWTYSTLNGLSEVATEYLIGGLPGLSKIDNLLKINPSSGSFETLGKILLNSFVIAPGQEIMEEELQLLLLDPLVHRIAYGEEGQRASLDEAIEVALQTYLSTLALNSATAIPQTAQFANSNINNLYDYLNSGELMRILVNNGIINGQSSLLESFLSPELIDKLNYWLESKQNIDYNVLSSEELANLRNKVNEVSEEDRNHVLCPCSLSNGESFGVTYGLLLDCIDLKTGRLSLDALRAKIKGISGYDVEDLSFDYTLFDIMRTSDNDIFNMVQTNLISGNYYATLQEAKNFMDEFGLIDSNGLLNQLISEGKVQGAFADESSITYSSSGKVKTIDRGKLFEYIANTDFSYENFTFNMEFDGMTSTELIRLISELDKNKGSINLTPSEQAILDGLDHNQVDRLVDYYYSSNEVKEVLLWIRDTLPGLYDCLGDLVSQKDKDGLRYSATILDSKDKYIDYYMQDCNVSKEYAEKTKGYNHNGNFISYLNGFLKSVLVHEGNHSLGEVRLNGVSCDGIDESLTESFNHRVQKANNTSFPRYIAYTPGTLGIDTLMDANIPGLSISDFEEAYFKTHDLSKIKETVDNIMGKGYFEKEFLPAFDTVLVDSNVPRKEQKERIDKVVSDITTTYRTQF